MSNEYFYLVVCECIDNGDTWIDGIFPKFKIARKRVSELKKDLDKDNFGLYIITKSFGVIDWNKLDDLIDDNKLVDYNV